MNNELRIMEDMKKNTERGAATIELLIALAVGVIFITGATLVSFGAQTSGLDTGLTNEGLRLAELGTADTVASVAAAWNYTQTELTGFYDSVTNIDDISDCMKSVDRDTTWTSEKNRGQYSSMKTLVANWAAAKANGGGCSPIPPSDEWDNPDSFGSVDLSGADGTGVDVRSVGGINYAFVTADPGALPAEDFMVVDVSDPDNIDPSIDVRAINTGLGLNGVAVGGNYAYVLQNKNTEQLQVIDITTPLNPLLIAGAATLPNITFTCPPPGSVTCLAGRSIAYSAQRVYVGTQYLFNGALPETKNNEFHIYDVSSPSSPVWLGSLNVNHNVNDIEIDGNYAYLATSDDVGELTIVDISNPAFPTIAGKFDAKKMLGGASDEDGWSVDVVATIAYLGRERVNDSDEERDFYILDVSNPSLVTIVGSKLVGMTPGSDIYVSGVAKQGNFAFISTTDSNEPFYVIDITNPANPINHSTCGLNFSQVTRGLKYFDNFIFTVNRSNDILRIIYDQPTACS